MYVGVCAFIGCTKEGENENQRMRTLYYNTIMCS